MKFYQALPMLFIALSSCGDDSRSTDDPVEPSDKSLSV